MEVMECDDQDYFVTKADKEKSFSEITEEDSYVSEMILSDNNWKLQTSLQYYFSRILKVHVNNIISSITLLSWNLDHISEKFIDERILEQANVIIKVDADIVLVQEITYTKMHLLKELLKNHYICLFPTDLNNIEYFNGILIRHSQLTKILDKPEIINFPSSQMSRQLFCVTLHLNGFGNLRIMTSHLESLKDYGEERKKQLKFCWDYMKNYEKYNCRAVLFGGDLNIRNKEIIDLGGIPKDIKDVAEWFYRLKNDAMDSNRSVEHALDKTWDTSVNHNLDINSDISLRFDRLYYNDKSLNLLTPTEVKIVGNQLVKDVNIYPSDHWGLFSEFIINR